MKIEWLFSKTLPEGIIRRMEKAAQQCLPCEGVSQSCSVTVLLCDDETIAAINAEQRGVSGSTDDLSFPTVRYPAGLTAGSCEGLLRREYDDETGSCFLGDIVLSVPHVYAQAEEYGHSPEREATYLLVHGICHLMGYDHMTDPDRKQMRAMEERILSAASPEQDPAG